jgi:hypothetical protein
MTVSIKGIIAVYSNPLSSSPTAQPYTGGRPAAPPPSTGYPNPLRNFASYTYVLTLSALRRDEVNSASKILNAVPHDIIARTGGIGNNSNNTSVQQATQNTQQATQNIISNNNNLADNTINALKNTASKLINTINSSTNLADTAILNRRNDIFFEKVTIDSTVQNNEIRYYSNINKIDMEMTEPLGCTLINKIRAAALNCGYPQHNQAPFLLIIEFKGWDENGKEVTNSADIKTLNSLRRVIPITITDVVMQINQAGTKYTVKAMPWGEQGFLDKYDIVRGTNNTLGAIVSKITGALKSAAGLASFSSFVPGSVIPNAAIALGVNQTLSPGSSDLQTALTQMANNLTSMQKDNEVDQNLRQYVDTYIIKVEPGIFNGANLNSNQAGGSPAGGYVANYTAGARISQVIGDLVLQGDSYKKTMANLKDLWEISSAAYNAQDVTTISALQQRLNNNPLGQNPQLVIDWFKIKIEIDLDPTKIDNILKTPARTITYKVVPFKLHLLNAAMPGMSGDKSWLNNIFKVYNYIFTGQNSDILDLEIKYDAAYGRSLLLNRQQLSTDQTSTASQVDQDKKVGILNWFGTHPDPIGPEPHLPLQAYLTPVFRESIYTTGSEATTERQILDYLVNNPGDMVNVNMKILGDPAFIGQDQYVARADGTGKDIVPFGDLHWNDQYHSFMVDTAQTVIKINWNFPTDMDEQTGLLTTMDTESQVPFNGLYRVNNILSEFENGKFTQTLDCSRLPAQGSKPTKLLSAEEIKNQRANDNIITVLNASGGNFVQQNGTIVDLNNPNSK